MHLNQMHKIHDAERGRKRNIRARKLFIERL
jgi:hypothetical protein